MFNNKKYYTFMILVAATGILGPILVMGCEEPETYAGQQKISEMVDRDESSAKEEPKADEKSVEDQISQALRAVIFPEETRPNLENFAYNGDNFFGSTTEELFKNFGEPLVVKESLVENTHYPEYEDVVTEFSFEGLNVIAYRVNEYILKNTEHLIRIDVTRDWKDPVTGLGIGISRENVLNIIGQPDESERSTDTYSVNNDDVSPPDVVISYENKKVVRIRCQYSLD